MKIKWLHAFRMLFENFSYEGEFFVVEYRRLNKTDGESLPYDDNELSFGHIPSLDDDPSEGITVEIEEDYSAVRVRHNELGNLAFRNFEVFADYQAARDLFSRYSGFEGKNSLAVGAILWKTNAPNQEAAMKIVASGCGRCVEVLSSPVRDNSAADAGRRD